MDYAVSRKTTIKEIVSKYINDGYRSRCWRKELVDDLVNVAWHDMDATILYMDILDRPEINI